MNRLIERLIQIIVERARAQIVYFALLLKLWAESLNTMIYLRIWSLSSVVLDKVITLFQAWYQSDLLAIDHIQIFGFIVYVFNKAKPKPKLVSKTWTEFLIAYERHHLYRIYNPKQKAVYIRRNIIFDKDTVRPTRR